MQPQVQTELSLSTLSEEGPHVVALGGGHGLSKVLEAVQQYAGKITAVVTATDDGGSSGRIIGDIKIPPPGDIRRCLLAMSSNPTIFGELFGHRFDSADVAGHSLGNLMLAALADLTGDFSLALRLAEDELVACGRVHPVALQALSLCARVGGRDVRGQVAVQSSSGQVEDLWLEPSDVRANPASVAAIAEADQIVLAPGSLYTSLLSTLVVPGISDAVNAARARLVYVANLTTQTQETQGMTARAHVETLRTIGNLARGGTIVEHRGTIHAPEGTEAISLGPGLISVDDAMWDVVADDLVEHNDGWPAHNAISLGRVLGRL